MRNTMFMNSLRNAIDGIMPSVTYY
jgi:hypothetical protein